MMSDHRVWNQYSRPVSNGLFSTVLVSSLMKYADAESSHSMDFPKDKSVVTSKAKSVATCHLARREQKSQDGSEERPGEVHRGDHHRPGGHRCFLWNVCQVAICLFIHPLLSHATSTWRGSWICHFSGLIILNLFWKVRSLCGFSSHWEQNQESRVRRNPWPISKWEWFSI